MDTYNILEKGLKKKILEFWNTLEDKSIDRIELSSKFSQHLKRKIYTFEWIFGAICELIDDEYFKKIDIGFSSHKLERTDKEYKYET